MPIINENGYSRIPGVDPEAPPDMLPPSFTGAAPQPALGRITSGGGDTSPNVAFAGGSHSLGGAPIMDSDKKALGKQIYQAERPQIPPITDDPSSLREQQIARQNQMLYDSQHPWGSPISAHPGALGKIGHVAAEVGNIAGNVFAPGVMANIPGTQMHNRIEEMQNLHDIHQSGQLENQTTEAEAQKERADTEAKKEEQNQPEEIEYDKNGDAIGVKVGGRLLSKDSPELTADQREILGSAKPKEGKQVAAHITYEGHLPVTITKGDQVYDVNDPKLPAELKPLVDSANKAYQKLQSDEEAKEGRVADRQAASQARQFAQQEKMFQERQAAPTTQQKNIASQAQLAAEGIPGVLQEVDRLKDKLGPVSGRWNDFMQGKVGMDDPDMAGLRADLMMTASAVALAHARGRLPENLRQEFDHMINAPKQSPENIKATLNHILPWLQRAGAVGKTGGNAQDPLGIR